MNFRQLRLFLRVWQWVQLPLPAPFGLFAEKQPWATHEAQVGAGFVGIALTATRVVTVVLVDVVVVVAVVVVVVVVNVVVDVVVVVVLQNQQARRICMEMRPKKG